MKLDYDLLKEIVEHIEEVSDGQTINEVGNSTVSTLGLPSESFDVVAYLQGAKISSVLSQPGDTHGAGHRGSVWP